MNFLEKLYEAINRGSYYHFLSVYYDLCGKLISPLESLITFDERFKVTSVPIFIPDFNLLNCESNNFTFTLYIDSFYIDITLSKIRILSHFQNGLYYFFQ